MLFQILFFISLYFILKNLISEFLAIKILKKISN